MVLRRALACLVLIGCGHPARDIPPPPAPLPPAAPQPCGDLSRDSIAGAAIDRDDRAVRRALGPPPNESAPADRTNPIMGVARWMSTSRWPAHDLRVTWVAEGPTAPRRAYTIELGPRSDLETTCGIRIGSHRDDVARAYRNAVATWTNELDGAAAQGVLDVGPATADTIMLASADGAVIGMVTLTSNRVAGITFATGAVMFEHQW